MPEEFTFDVEADRRAAARMGDGHGVDTVVTGDAIRFQSNPGGSSIGLTNDTPEYEAARKAELERPTPEADEQSELARLKEETAYLKSKLGEQGAQMGELRAMAARAAQLEAQQAAMQRAQQTAAPTPGLNAIPDFFQDIPDGERFMSSSERSRINQLLALMATATESRLNAIGENAAYVAGKTAAGISDEEEARIATSNPWVNKLSGFDRVQAVKSLAEAAKASKEAPGRTATEAARLAARREAFVESSSGISRESTDSTEPAMEKLSKDIHAGKFKSADDIKKALRKLGIGQQDEYGRMS